MSKLKVGQGDSTLEKQALDAHLQRLGVKVEEDRTITPGGSRVAMTDLERAATTTGAPDVLDLADTMALKEPRSVGESIKRLVGKDAESIAHASLQSASLTLEGAASSLEVIGNRVAAGGISTEEVFHAARLINNAVGKVKEAISDEALSFARPAEIDRLREAYAGFMSAFVQNAAAFETTAQGELDYIKAVVEDHNSRTLSRLFTGANAMELVHKGAQLIDVQGSMEALLGFREAFDFNGVEKKGQPAEPLPVWMQELMTGSKALDGAVKQLFDWSEEHYERGHVKHGGSTYHVGVLCEGAIVYEQKGSAKAKPIDVLDFKWDDSGRVSLAAREGTTGALDALPGKIRDQLAQAATQARKTEHFI
jgi:hypothetical protein